MYNSIMERDQERDDHRGDEAMVLTAKASPAR